MKSLKLLATGLVAIAAVSMASAQTYIRFTGSTAFRASAVKAIENSLNTGFTCAANGTTTAGAGITTWVGTTKVGSNSVVIQASWTGSVDGIRDLTTSQNNTYILASKATSTSVTGLTAVDTTNGSNIETGVADISMADNLQTSTSYKTPALTQTIVGVVPFVFVKGRLNASHSYKAAWDLLTNMSPNGARALLNNGTYLSVLTGNSDAAWATYFNGGTLDGEDTRFKVYALGRNPFSGTRVVTLTEAGYGTSAATFQYKGYRTGDTVGTVPTVAAGDTIVTTDQYPAGTASGQAFAKGNNSFSSGGTLANELSATVSAAAVDANGNPFGFVGYVGTSDAAAFLKNVNGGTGTDTSYVLSYNGVTLQATYNNGTQTTSWDYTPIREGRYTLWGNEYLSYRTSVVGSVGAVKRDFADAVATEIKTNTASLAGVLLSTMKVDRSAEGGVITAK